MNHLPGKGKDKVIITQIIVSKPHFSGSFTQGTLFTLTRQPSLAWSVEGPRPGQGRAATHADEQR